MDPIGYQCVQKISKSFVFKMIDVFKDILLYTPKQSRDLSWKLNMAVFET